MKTDKQKVSKIPNEESLENCRKFHFITEISLWNLLFPKQMQPLTASARKLSKPEAFVDLINRQRLAMVTNDEKFCEITAVALAKAWGWDRITVKRFLAALEEIEAVTLTQATHGRTVIRLNNILG